jgi:parallel beta-helix repeat protein
MAAALLLSISSAWAINLTDSGFSDPTAGTWDPVTRTATLTRDVDGQITVAVDDVILDGGGYVIRGPYANLGHGVLVSGRNNVTVRGVIALGFSVGIGLYGSSNNHILDNEVADNVFFGIYLENSSNNNLIEANITRDNGYEGIRLRGSSSTNVVVANIARNNLHSGIAVHSNDNLVADNVLTANWGGFTDGGARNSFENNLVTENTLYGVLLNSSGDATLLGNTILANEGGGLRFIFASGTTMTANVVQDNLQQGLHLTSSTGSRIFANSFIDNALDNAPEKQARIDCCLSSNNRFYSDGLGNHWNDWTAPDADGDGIVDVAYVFEGGSDPYPLVRPVGEPDVLEVLGEIVDELVELDISVGVSASLDAKVQTALQALSDVNDNNDVAAINALGALINSLHAQAGQGIPEADANDLIDAANQAIALLQGE